MAQSMGQSSIVYCFREESYGLDLRSSILTNWNTGGTKAIKFGRLGPASHRCPKPTAGSRPDGARAAPRPAAAPQRGGEWQWEDSDGSWKSFDPEVKQLLQAARSMGKETVVFMVGKNSYE